MSKSDSHHTISRSKFHHFSKWVRSLSSLLMVTLLSAAVAFWLALTIPPWQHYDEPAHFEAARLIASRWILAEPEDHDPALSRQIMGSMAEFGFFTHLNDAPDLMNDVNPNIGYSQIDAQFLYYAYLAIPLRLASAYDVTMQLYIARLFSSLLFIITAVFAHEIAAMIFGRASPMRWLLPTAIVLTLPFADLMSGLNNDVGAAAISSILIWLIAYVWRNGWTRSRIVAVVLLAVLSLFVKLTTVPVVFFLLLSITLRTLVRLRYVLIGVIVLTIAAGFLLVDSNGAAGWVSKTSTASRERSAQSIDGGYVLKVNRSTATNNLTQRIPLPKMSAGVNAIYTLGAWMWKDGPPEDMPMPLLQNIATGEILEYKVRVTNEPRWFTQTLTLIGDWRRASILLTARAGSDSLYIDNVQLVSGPNLNSDENLVINGSFEQPALRLLQTTTSLDTVLRFSSLRSIGMLQSQRHREPYLWQAVTGVIDTFWGKFGWSDVKLDESVLTALRFFTLLSLVSGLLTLPWHSPNERPFWIFAWIMSIVMWPLIVLRGVDTIFEGKYWLPAARYGVSGIVITWLLLLSGWRAAARALPKQIRMIGAWMGIVGLATLFIYGYSTISQYHAERTQANFMTVFRSQASWLSAHAAYANGNEQDALQIMARYQDQRKGNIYAPLAAAEMLTPSCITAPTGRACALAVSSLRSNGGQAHHALLRAEAQLNAGPFTSPASIGWVEVAKQLIDPHSSDYPCNAWRITLDSIPYGSPPEGFIQKVLVPGQSFAGAELRWPVTKKTQCGNTLGKVESDPWGNMWSTSSGTVVAHVPTSDVYVIRAILAGNDSGSRGRMKVDGVVLGDYEVRGTRKNPENFEWDVSLAAGWHKIEFTFDNDLNTSTTQRDLFVRSVVLDKQR
ncbi:MAG: hypothetical protein NTZ50_14960 [Chloroflexi bacterium]|nr:hypothetical protein [Chloroflexota bacterium]